MILLVKEIQYTYDSSPVRSFIDMQDRETSQTTSYSELLNRKRHWTSMGFSGSLYGQGTLVKSLGCRLSIRTGLWGQCLPIKYLYSRMLLDINSKHL